MYVNPYEEDREQEAMQAEAIRASAFTPNSSNLNSTSNQTQSSQENGVMSIPGDIKQQFLPVDHTKNPDKFTFKGGSAFATGTRRQMHGMNDGMGGDDILGIFPARNSITYDDISFLNTDETFEDIINNLPTLQIREFLPSSKLDQVLNVFGKFMEGFSAGSAGGDSKVDFTLSAMTNAWNVIWSELSKGEWIDKAYNSIPISNIKNSDDSYVIKLPYTLYYTLLTTTTTNYYELPFNSNEILKTNGASGWEGNKQFGFAGTSSNSTLGSILNMLGSNLTINASPIWKAGSYDNSEFSISFDLFNDNIDHAVANYKFVNTLFPNNLWIQYNIQQHSSDLYDIKLAGFARYFMCTGNFSLQSKGVMRHITSDTKLGMCLSEIRNQKLKGYPLQNCYMPDVYSIKMDFKSLLPNNFNNYIYNFIVTEDISEIEKGKQESVYGSIVDGLKKSVEKICKELKIKTPEEEQKKEQNGNKTEKN